MSVHDVGEYLGVAGATVSRWETGKHEPNDDVKNRLARFLDIPLDELLREDSSNSAQAIPNAPKYSTTKMDVPVVGEEPVWIDIVEPAACAGPGNGYHEVTWNPIGRLPFSPVDLMGYAWHSGKMRVIRIEGSSMEPRYREGDRVLFSDDGVVSGDIAIVMWDSRLYIRGYIVTPDKMVHLRAFNKENPEIVVDPGDPRLQILGKVLAKVGIEPDKGFW